MAHVAFCLPHGRPFNPVWHRYLMTLQGEIAAKGHTITNVEVDMMIVGKARNMTVSQSIALTPPADVCWLIDDDVLVPPHATVLIDQALQLGVVSGVYYNRYMPYTPQVYKVATEDVYKERYHVYWPLVEDMPQSGLHKVDAVGAGCMVVATPVFQRLSAHFEPRYKEESEKLENPYLRDIVRRLSPWFEFLNQKGEDIYFCERCSEIGQDVWINADVQCAHIAEVPIDKAQFQHLVDNNMLVKGEGPVG